MQEQFEILFQQWRSRNKENLTVGAQFWVLESHEVCVDQGVGLVLISDTDISDIEPGFHTLFPIKV